MRGQDRESASASRSRPGRASARAVGPVIQGAPLTPQAVLHLQRVIGNAATVPLIEANVLEKCAAATYTPLDPAARGVGTVTAGPRAGKLREIVWENHWAPISEVCKKHRYTIAVRETGEHSIRRIAEGAKPKPHTILEKSIKDSSVRAKYGPGTSQPQQDPQEVLDWLHDRDLTGFVGHWDSGGLAGVRADNPPAGSRAADLLQHGAAGAPHVAVDTTTDGGGPALELLKTDPRWKQHLYTGDYDLHEAHAAAGGTGGGQIPEATREKVKLLNQLNWGIAEYSQEAVKRSGTAALEGGRVHMTDSAYAMFQHGDQATYRMNQYLESEVARHAAPLVQAVATETTEPLAWCAMGQWYVTMNLEEHAILRRKLGLKTPHTWGAKEVDRTRKPPEEGGYRTASFR